MLRDEPVDAVDVYALIPDGRSMLVVSVGDLTARLDDGETFDDAVSNASIDTIDHMTADRDAAYAAVETLNRTGGGYWPAREAAAR